MSDNNTASVSSRIAYIDFLKFVGLTGIIIAHVGAPNWLKMTRSFDVPLMVILSSILGCNSYKKYDGKKRGLFNYYSCRIKRLVFPTWIFLVFYFLLCLVVTKKPYSAKFYIASFCLTRYGIGYVWVILMYLYSAMLTPLYSKIGFSVKSTWYLLIVYVIYEIAFFYKIGTDNKLIDTTFYYIIPYGGVLTYLGYNYNQIRRKWIIVALSFSAFISLMIYYWVKMGSFQRVEILKYPPRCYYLSFGIAVSYILLIACERNDLKVYQNPIVTYISKHSMWIYLWHILVLALYEYTKLPAIWYIKLIVVYLCSLVIVYLINKVLDSIESRKDVSFLKYLRG